MKTCEACGNQAEDSALLCDCGHEFPYSDDAADAVALDEEAGDWTYVSEDGSSVSVPLADLNELIESGMLPPGTSICPPNGEWTTVPGYEEEEPDPAARAKAYAALPDTPKNKTKHP